MTTDLHATRPNPLRRALDPRAPSSIREQIGGALRTQAIYVIAKLGVPDQLALGPRTAEMLAKSTARVSSSRWDDERAREQKRSIGLAP